MSWHKILLGDVIKTRKGFAFKSSKYVNSGVPVVRVSNFTLDSINNEDLKYYPIKEKNNYLEYELDEKDIIIQTVGSWQNNPQSVVGKVVRVPYYLSGALLNQNAVKLIPKKNFDNNFLFYILKTNAFQGHVLGEARGAANQASITLDTIKSFEFVAPEYEIQKRIGDALSAYDDLIENNRKQIKLLGEAAQRLYKKWFIDLRFPGHEDVEIVDGIPEGWNIGILGDIGTFKRGKTITKTKIVEGEVPVISGGLGPAYYHNESNTSSPVITVSGSGANAGFTRLYYTKVFASDCSFVDIEQTPYLYWIYLFLKNNSSRLDMLQKGSAQPHVYAKDINALECVIPIKEVLNLFCEVVGSYFNKIGILEQQIIKLTEARNRLLPKLMSGEIEV